MRSVHRLIYIRPIHYSKGKLYTYWRPPTGLFTILEPQDQEIGQFNLLKKRRATYLEAPKLCKGR